MTATEWLPTVDRTEHDVALVDYYDALAVEVADDLRRTTRDIAQTFDSLWTSARVNYRRHRPATEVADSLRDLFWVRSSRNPEWSALAERLLRGEAVYDEIAELAIAELQDRLVTSERTSSRTAEELRKVLEGTATTKYRRYAAAVFVAATGGPRAVLDPSESSEPEAVAAVDADASQSVDPEADTLSLRLRYLACSWIWRATLGELLRQTSRVARRTSAELGEDQEEDQDAELPEEEQEEEEAEGKPEAEREGRLVLAPDEAITAELDDGDEPDEDAIRARLGFDEPDADDGEWDEEDDEEPDDDEFALPKDTRQTVFWESKAPWLSELGFSARKQRIITEQAGHLQGRCELVADLSTQGLLWRIARLEDGSETSRKVQQKLRRSRISVGGKRRISVHEASGTASVHQAFVVEPETQPWEGPGHVAARVEMEAEINEQRAIERNHQILYLVDRVRGAREAIAEHPLARHAQLLDCVRATKAATDATLEDAGLPLTNATRAALSRARALRKRLLVGYGLTSGQPLEDPDDRLGSMHVWPCGLGIEASTGAELTADGLLATLSLTTAQRHAGNLELITRATVVQIVATRANGDLPAPTDMGAWEALEPLLSELAVVRKRSRTWCDEQRVCCIFERGVVSATDLEALPARWREPERQGQTHDLEPLEHAVQIGRVIPLPETAWKLEPADFKPLVEFLATSAEATVETADGNYFLNMLFDQGVPGDWYFFQEGGIYVGA